MHNRVLSFAFSARHLFGTLIAVPRFWYLQPVKRYKQTILSNFFVAIDSESGNTDAGDYHLVEANLDIESRDDRALCTEVLHGEYRYEVLTNQLLASTCPICSAILKRRISNMPLERKPGSLTAFEETEEEIPETQMALLLEMNEDEEGKDEPENPESGSSSQFELFG